VATLTPKQVAVFTEIRILVDFDSGIAQLEDDTRRKYEGRLDEVPGIFATMKPMDGAIEAYKRLATVFDTYILSTAP
jgi:hypothetical protein